MALELLNFSKHQKFQIMWFLSILVINTVFITTCQRLQIFGHMFEFIILLLWHLIDNSSTNLKVHPLPHLFQLKQLWQEPLSHGPCWFFMQQKLTSIPHPSIFTRRKIIMCPSIFSIVEIWNIKWRDTSSLSTSLLPMEVLIHLLNIWVTQTHDTNNKEY